MARPNRNNVPKKYVIEYNGVKHTVQNANQLAKKARMSIPIAKLYFNANVNKTVQEKKNNNTRYVYKTDGKIAKINLQDNFGPLIRREFAVNQIRKDKFINDGEIKKGVRNLPSTYAIKNLDPNFIVDVNITITVYLVFPSGNALPITREEFKDMVNDNREILKDEQLLGEYNIVKRLIGNNKYNGTINNISNYIEDRIDEYANDVQVIYETIDISDSIGNKLEYKNQRLREEYPLPIVQWKNIEDVQNKKGENCVINWINTKFSSKFEKYEIDNLREKNNNGIKIKDMLNLFEKHNIYCVIYDENGNKKESNTVKEIKIEVHMIVYNNHIYPIKSNRLRKDKFGTPVEIITTNIVNEIKKFLKININPFNIHVSDQIKKGEDRGRTKITSFMVKENKTYYKYIENDEYEKCKKILKKYKLEDKIYDSIRIVNLVSIFEEAYILSNIRSFFPSRVLRYNKEAFTYVDKSMLNEVKDGKYHIYSMDKNKCYAYCLYSLDFLIQCDWRTAKITINPESIISDRLYVVKPKYSTILMPNTNYYSGYHVNYCKNEGVQFEVLEEITTKQVPNGFKNIINILLKDGDITNNEFKEMMNIYIGKMKSEKTIVSKYESNLRTKESIQYENGYKINIDDKYVVQYETKSKIGNPYNMKPIDIQIKDRSRVLLYEKLKEIGIKDKREIVKINTDSIVFVSKEKINLQEKYKLDKNDFAGWKEEPLKLESLDVKYSDPTNFSVSFYHKKQHDINKQSELHKCYAGTGKTHYIINTLIPKLKLENKTFLVLTPTNRSTIEFLNSGLEHGKEVDVIQTYEYSKKIPNVDCIIVDEIGMVGRAGHDFLFSVKQQTDVQLFVFGDFQQILPFGETKPITSPQYERYMYDYIYMMKNNHRNDFPISFYDSIINTSRDNYARLIQLVNKYSLPRDKLYEAEYIACYRKSTKDKYNRQCILRYGFNSRTSKGVRLICQTRKLKELGVYNGQMYIVMGSQKIDKNEYIMVKEYNSTDDTYTIPKKAFNKYFDYGYAINIHKFQGSQLGSYYWCSEDNNFLTPRIAYTIISRLTGKVYGEYTEQEILERISNTGPYISMYNMSVDLHIMKKIEYRLN